MRIFFAIFIAVIAFLLNFLNRGVYAQECSGDLESRIACYESNIVKLKESSKTLSNQIAQFDAQIRLTTLKISQTEAKINLLSGRIDQLTGSLESLNNAFNKRVVETYKMARMGSPLALAFSQSSLSEVFSTYSYLKKIQDADRNLLVRLQKAQDAYEEEKLDQEDLQRQLEEQKKNLDNQKAAKAYFLAATKNDEKKYQQLLAQARAEYEAIQAIIAGRGTETEVGNVNEGQKIATIIQGASCNSGGTHLHFIVRKQNNSTENPFNYLRGGIDFENCSGSSCGSSDGDLFNPSGSWNWPVQPKIKFTQGYGNTWAIKNTWVGRIYNFHNGIDINSLSSSEVKAVRAGKLYQGSYNVGCKLKYVRVDHDDSDLDTLYLHINY